MEMPPGYWLNKDSRTFLSRGYLKEGQTAEERIRQISERAEEILGIPGFADEWEQDILKGWGSLSSPIWSNFGNPRNLPISCNGSWIPDDTGEILRKNAEVGMMSKYGAGTSAYFGAVRWRGADISTGGVSDGSVHFMEMLQSTVSTISQSNVRRGNIAVYLPIDHPDIKEFLKIKEEGHPIQHISFGVTVTDDWMDSMIDGDKDKRKLWTKVLQKRAETGYPYIFFTDTVNRGRSKWYKDQDMKIWASNLCTEIALPSSWNESFVCDLMSLNVLHYDEWKDTDFPKRAAYFLDAVMTEYIEKAKGIQWMEDAVRFAERHRAIGVGVLGWHSLLQSKMVAFESVEAKVLNVEVFKLIREKVEEASREMAVKYGEPEVMKGYGFRNSAFMAPAPTTSSSFILGQVSPSIEPENSNYYIKDLAKGKFTYKNPHLKKLLKSKGLDDAATWADILVHGGSVQHMETLSDQEKKVFKTFGEIAQIEVIMQAADRQRYIDQSQSINLMIHPSAPLKDVNALTIEAWKLGVKTLYYQRSTNPAQEYARELLSCVSCEA